jgi:hypothetical protein
MPSSRLVNSQKACPPTCLDLKIIQCMSSSSKSADSRYVLERHLKREEVIQPKREIGRFRGEPVYRRQNVLSCKTAENWMRIGRKVKDRQEPLKWVKQRAVTIQSKDYMPNIRLRFIFLRLLWMERYRPIHLGISICMLLPCCLPGLFILPVRHYLTW